VSRSQNGLPDRGNINSPRAEDFEYHTGMTGPDPTTARQHSFRSGLVAAEPSAPPPQPPVYYAPPGGGAPPPMPGQVVRRKRRGRGFSVAAADALF
jgi:hypothetical protein